MSIEFYSDLNEYIRSIESPKNQISPVRVALLNEMVQFISRKIQKDQRINLLFVCTHNSRRSHFGQIWASVAAYRFGLDEYISTYSGGTEITAFNPRAVAALSRIGFRIESESGINPHYKVHYAEGVQSIDCYSKKFNDHSIPTQNLIAIMTCSEADQDCPYIPGAESRVPLHYEDPKVADDTPQESARYDERCRQIAREMFYVMEKIKTSN